MPVFYHREYPSSMNTTEALKARKSVRAFLKKPVSPAQVEQILEAARCAPSGTNTQPWKVIALAGEPKNALQALLEAEFRSGKKGKMDYLYYPEKWADPYLARRRACGLQLYSTLDIKREDKQRQMEQWIANYHSFAAPVVLLFFMDKMMETGSFLDYGMFLQSVMLAAVDQGLATCPQAALGEYPDTVREFLGIAADQTLICGMALGYEDTEAVVNSYRTPRESVDSFTRFMGFA